jgi:hypothetical protein
MTPEDQRALNAARAQAAALYEERRRLAAQRREALGIASEQSRAAGAGRRPAWPLVLSAALVVLAAAAFILMGRP